MRVLVVLFVVTAVCRGDTSPSPSPSLSDVVGCGQRDDIATCLEEKAVQALKTLTTDQGESRSDSAEDGDEHSLLEEVEELISLGVSRLFQDGSQQDDAEADADSDADDEDPEDAERSLDEGRGKKKKKKQALMKLFMLAMLIKSKISMLVGALSTFLQLKFFGIAILNLLIGLIRLWVEWSKHKTPQKVIYYEHAQHQHHYEHEHHYDDEGQKGSWGSLWSRSLDPADANKAQGLAYSAHTPNQS